MAFDFEKFLRLGPAAFVLKAILAAVAADVLLLSFIMLRRGYRRWYFAKRDARVIEIGQQWDALVSGEIFVSTCIVTGGEVLANIRARDAIELYAPAKVTGALHAPAIFIDRGVTFEGTCKMAPLDD